MSHEIAKALEVWTLQSLLNFSIILGWLALGLSVVHRYYSSLKNHLTLRVSIEIWDLVTTILVDILLVIVVLVGFFILNPDIMADIKVAVPFVPVATIIFAAALIIRLFHGGHKIASPGFRLSLWLMFAANVINVIGFSFIMEAPSGEYLANHPSAFWTFVKTHLRSNADPYGLETAQVTFYICFPILIAIFIWGIARGMNHLKKLNEDG